MIERDLRCPQGDSFHFNFTVRKANDGEPGDTVDLTDKVGYGEVRDSLSNGNLVLTFQFNSTEEDLENGVVSMYISREETDDVPVGTYFYDIILVDNVDSKTYFKGKFFVINRITENV
jgi:hypothetical protein